MRFDTLEQRQLLSVSPLDPQAILVNQLYGQQQATSTGHSVGMNDNGDFVVAWSRTDGVLDASGNPVIDPETGLLLTDSNIYARYFTNELQRLQLPLEIQNNFDDDPVTMGHFNLRYDAQTIYQLSVTASTYRNNDPNFPFNPADQLIHGTFTLWFDANNDGAVQATTYNPDGTVLQQNETINVVFDENDPAISATNIQNGLRAIPAVPGVSDPSQVVVSAVTPHDYTIDFGEATRGLAQPSLSVVQDTNYLLTGFLPGVLITTVQQPFTINNIPVSQEDPNQTAVGIQNFLQQRMASWTMSVAPFDNPASLTSPTSASGSPYTYPIANQYTTPVATRPQSGYDPSVSVRILNSGDLTEFDLYFTGTSGKKIHAPFLVTAATDETGAALDVVNGAKVKVMKQSSPEFRVNPPEPSSPFALIPQVTDQDQAAVAMDPSGDFVIAWRSEVLDSVTPGSVTDIFARRYSPVGVTGSYAPGTYVPGQVVTGVRVLPTPSSVTVQQLVFDAGAGAVLPLVGSFQLSVAGYTTPDIVFNGADLPGTARNIQSALTGLGFVGTTVTNVTSTLATRYRFTVRFEGSSVGQDIAPIVYVPSALPLNATVTVNDLSGDKYTFRANTNAANPQFDPAVAMDLVGDFVVTWANGGQDISFFNGISMQRFDRNGLTVGQETEVNPEQTEIQYVPDIALTEKGYAVISWTQTTDPGYLTNGPFLSRVYAAVFDPKNNPVWSDTNAVTQAITTHQIFVGGGGYSSVAVDAAGNYTIAWQAGGLGSTDDNGSTSIDVVARQFQLFDTTTGNPIVSRDPNLANPMQVLPPTTPLGPGVAVGARLRRDIFRVNSSALSTAPFYPSAGNSPNFPRTSWPFDQFGVDAVSDADGDLMFTYEGYGMDVSSNVQIPSVFFQQFFRDPRTGQSINQDLLPYFNPLGANGGAGQTLSGMFQSPRTILGQSNSPITNSNLLAADVDLVIDQVMYAAMYTNANPLNPAVPVDAEKLGRLRAILESVAGLLRGSADGTLLTRWDADPILGTLHATYTDSIVNSQRDGSNQRFFIEVPGMAEQGSVTFTITAPLSPVISTPVTKTFTVQLPPTGTFGKFNVNQFDADLETAINQAFGANWTGYGSAVVRIVHGAESGVDEITARDGTPWDVPVNPANYFVDTHAGDGAEHTTPWNHGATLYEIVFQGDLHDLPIGVATASVVQGWIQNPANNDGDLPPPALVGLGDIVVTSRGDTTGNIGTPHEFASLATTSSGNMVAAYTQGELLTTGDSPVNDANATIYQNIYYRQLAESTDTAGPRIVGATDNAGRNLDSGTSKPLPGEEQKYIILTFNEEMMTGDPATNADSVFNRNNYQLSDNKGSARAGLIQRVDYGMSVVAELAGLYGLNPIPSNKWEVILTVDGDPSKAGFQGLPDGTYTLRVLRAVQAGGGSTGAAQSGVRDRNGNSLGRTGYTPAGVDYTVTYTTSKTGPSQPIGPGYSSDTPINSTTTGSPDWPVVAAGKSGYHVAAWVRHGADGDAGNNGNIVAQIFDGADNTVGPEFIVNNITTGNQFQPAVAMNDSGQFAVVWSGQGPNYNAATNSSDVFARLFDSTGRALGNQITVNRFESGVQNEPSVAMAADGSFIVTWSSVSWDPLQDGNVNTAIYKRRFDATGSTTTIPDEMVSSPSTYRRAQSDIAMNPNGDYVIAWTADLAEPNTWGYYGRYYYYANGNKSAEFRMNNSTIYRVTLPSAPGMNASLTGPRVSMADNGSFVATWAAYTSSATGLDVFARQFAAGGAARNPAEFLVNTYSIDQNTLSIDQNTLARVDQTSGWQLMPDVGVASNGDFTVVFTSYDKDNADVGNPSLKDYGIYARMFTNTATGYADYTDPALPTGMTTPMVFRVNATTVGNQVQPSVDRKNLAGDSIIVWAGPNPNGSGIYSRSVDPPEPLPDVKPVVRAQTPVPSLSIGDVSIQVGAAASQANFVVSLSTPTTVPVAFGYNTFDLTLTSRDYTYKTGVLLFAPGETTKTITVPVAGKTVVGLPDQKFKLVACSPVNATISRGTGTATVIDVLTAAPSISVADVTLQVGTAATQAVFTVTLSSAATGTITMDYGTDDRTAKASAGAYTPTWGKLTFSAGETSKTISVPVAGLKSAGLPNQTFILNLANAVGGKIIRAPATATIVDVVPPPTALGPSISVADISLQVGTAATQAVFTVSLSSAATGTITMDYGTADGTAKASAGAYTPTWGKLTFSAGQTSKTVSVPVAGLKSAGLPNQTFILNLANAVGGKIVRSPATATIIDVIPTTSALPAISIGSVIVTRPASGTSTASFLVNLSAVPKTQVTVSYATANGTALAGLDYTAVSGTLTFAPGVTSKLVTVPILARSTTSVVDFAVLLSSPVNGTLRTSRGTATIKPAVALLQATAPKTGSSTSTNGLVSLQPAAVATVLANGLV